MRTTKEYMDLYTDYLISLQGQATATGLSKIVEELSQRHILNFVSKYSKKIIQNSRTSY